jgi:protoporphyrin/coproporphyrin ferrochelatase
VTWRPPAAPTACWCAPRASSSDHLEVVYDLDIEAAAVAAEVRLPFARTRVLNDDAAVLGALADRILAAAP